MRITNSKTLLQLCFVIIKKSSGTLILQTQKTQPIDVLLLINLIIRLLLHNYYESL